MIQVLKTVIVCGLILLHEVSAFTGPLRIRMGAASAENQGRQDAGIVYAINSDGGSDGFEAQDALDRNTERKLIKAADVNSYGEHRQDDKHRVDEGEFAKDAFKNNGGTSVSDFGVNNDHKKGHHKSGFHNTYHKDESGSNSSYFDDSNDRGGEFVRNRQEGAYGQKGAGSSRGSHLDGNRYNLENSRHGGFENADSYDKEQGRHRQLANEGHRRDAHRHGENDQANRFGAGGESYAERYHEPSSYHQPHHYIPHPPVQPYHSPAVAAPFYRDEGYDGRYHMSPRRSTSTSTITVYEDPRYLNQEIRRGGTTYDRDRVHREYGPYFVDDSVPHRRAASYDSRAWGGDRSLRPHHRDYFY